LVLANDGNVESCNCEALAEVERRDFGSDLEIDDLSVDDDGSEQQADPELLELDRDRVVLLGDRERKLAARDELGFLAALGNEVRLGQRPQRVPFGQGLDDTGVVGGPRRQEKATATLGRGEAEVGSL